MSDIDAPTDIEETAIAGDPPPDDRAPFDHALSAAKEKSEVEDDDDDDEQSDDEADGVAAAGKITDVVSPDHAQHLRLLEALVFAGTQALDEKELADRLPNDANVALLLADLGELYANRGVNLVKVAGGYAFRTASDLSEKLKIERPVTRKLSAPPSRRSPSSPITSPSPAPRSSRCAAWG